MDERNKKLERYQAAFAQDMEVAYVTLSVDSQRELGELEKTAIKQLRPTTNIIHA